MSLAEVVQQGRTAAEALMVDACDIRGEATGATDPDTGEWSETPGALLYSGKCRVQVQDSLMPQTPDYGGGEVTLQRTVVSIPATSASIPVGAVVTMTAAVHDPALVGVTYTVTAEHKKTHATARRLMCEEVTSGAD